jgi:endonuclease VIII
MIDRRIVTTRPADRPHPHGKARCGETHYVYRRHRLPCFVCGGEIRREEFIGRKLYWCPECQPGVAGSRSVTKDHLLSA